MVPVSNRRDPLGGSFTRIYDPSAPYRQAAIELAHLRMDWISIFKGKKGTVAYDTWYGKKVTADQMATMNRYLQDFRYLIFD